MSAARVEQRRGEEQTTTKLINLLISFRPAITTGRTFAVLLPTARLRPAKWTAHRSGKSVITTGRQRQ